MFRNLNQNLAAYVDSATGSFKFDGPHDQWIIDRTRQWCGLYTHGEWSYRIDMPNNTITFRFGEQRDADVFRKVTQRSPTLITCR